jgi:hypothetical protein
MSWRSMNRSCSQCAHQDEYLANKEENKDSWYCTKETDTECVSEPETECRGVMEEMFAAPAILTSESATFLDGTKRPGFQSMRDAALAGRAHGRG